MTHIIFVHCGLHKTGTTAIQTALSEHRDALRERGVLYPPTGSDEVGHHNLAWEIVGDRRFDPDGLTLARVVLQIAAFAGTVVLSSEDFEGALHRPEMLAPLVQSLRGVGREVCLVIYTRNPTDYAESLYVELLQHGYAETFAAYIREIRSTGSLRFREWTFQFDPARLVPGLAALPETRVIWRVYDEVITSGSVVNDFLSIIGLDASSLADAASRRLNIRNSAIGSLSLFCSGQLSRPLHAGESAAIGGLCDRSPPLRLIAGPRQRLDNGPFSEGSDTARLERVCSARTLWAIRALGHLSDSAPRVAGMLKRALLLWWAGQSAASSLRAKLTT